MSTFLSHMQYNHCIILVYTILRRVGSRWCNDDTVDEVVAKKHDSPNDIRLCDHPGDNNNGGR